MDLISHALIGAIISTSQSHPSWVQRSLVVAFSCVPDLPGLFEYVLLGREKGRRFWIAENSDWVDARRSHPLWSLLWDVPHSLFFMLGVILPVVMKMHFSLLFVGAYGFHIFVDLFTHTGQWAIRPFYPFHFTTRLGFTDAWSWPLRYMALSWSALAVTLGLLWN